MSLRDVRVLLVDDSADSSELYELALGLEGAEVAAVSTAAHALAALDAASFDVVVSDVRLGGMDGYELVREIRLREGRKGGGIAVIALTGLAYQGDRDAAFAAGFDEHVTKPCAPSELAATIGEVLARTATRRERRPAANPVSLAGICVLAVDDQEVDRYLVERALKARGASVVTVASGEEAMAAIESLRPDVLVSDILMPSGSGFDLLKRVRELPAEAGGRVPAVAVTVLESAADRAALRNSGFDEHVAKPFDAELLTAIVAALASSTS